MSIGTEIAKIRTDAGWSQARLAKETGLSSSYIFYVENDEVLPSAEKIREMLEPFHLDPEPLVRMRDELELDRLNLDAPTIVRLKEEFGELSASEREAVVDLLRGLRAPGNRDEKAEPARRRTPNESPA